MTSLATDAWDRSQIALERLEAFVHNTLWHRFHYVIVNLVGY